MDKTKNQDKGTDLSFYALAGMIGGSVLLVIGYLLYSVLF